MACEPVFKPQGCFSKYGSVNVLKGGPAKGVRLPKVRLPKVCVLPYSVKVTKRKLRANKAFSVCGGVVEGRYGGWGGRVAGFLIDCRGSSNPRGVSADTSPSFSRSCARRLISIASGAT